MSVTLTAQFAFAPFGKLEATTVIEDPNSLPDVANARAALFLALGVAYDTDPQTGYVIPVALPDKLNQDEQRSGTNVPAPQPTTAQATAVYGNTNPPGPRPATTAAAIQQQSAEQAAANVVVGAFGGNALNVKDSNKNAVTIDGNNPRCATCSGEVYDNRRNKRNERSPDFKCKDKGCDTAFWLS